MAQLRRVLTFSFRPLLLVLAMILDIKLVLLSVVSGTASSSSLVKPVKHHHIHTVRKLNNLLEFPTHETSDIFESAGFTNPYP